MGLSIILEKITPKKKPTFFYFNNFWNSHNWLIANVECSNENDKNFEVSESELKDLLDHLKNIKTNKRSNNISSYTHCMSIIDEEIASIEKVLKTPIEENSLFYYSYCN